MHRIRSAAFMLSIAWILFIFPTDTEAQPVRVEPAAEGLLPTEKLPGKGVFIAGGPRAGKARYTIWFEDQFLGDGKAYKRRAKEFAKWPRRKLRVAVRKTLKALSDKSYGAVKDDLDRLIKAGDLKNLERYWILNGFSCNATPAGVKALQKIKSVRAIFPARPSFRFKAKKSPKQFFKAAGRRKFDPKRYKHPWYVYNLLADRVWTKFGVTGAGTLNVVHDFNFVFSKNLTYNLYRNPKEKPNNKDDDGNGLVDDIHGFDFQFDRANLTRQRIGPDTANPRVMHGFMCAAIMCGAGAAGAKFEFGIAPEGRWAGVIAGNRIEAAVEWAVDQGADTYSMSFSIPNLGEYRSHWRKVMEHGSFCGVYFVSGAGNFAQKVKVPVQMRVPEDIPNAVFAATGVQRNFSRTPFSSKGPVLWKTHFYQDGRVDRPDVCAFNMGLPLLKLNGKVVPVAISGNSFAGPMTGGSLALMLSADPDLLPWDARKILTATATDVAKKGFDHETGHGLINCYRAVKEVLRRKAVRDGKDAADFTGREKGDALDINAVKKNLGSVLRIVRVQPRGQAAKKGLKAGDVIISYNGKSIANRQDLMKAKKDADGKTIPLVVQRAGKQITVQLAPGPLGIVPAVGFREPVFR